MEKKIFFFQKPDIFCTHGQKCPVYYNHVDRMQITYHFLQNVSSQVTCSETKSLEKDIEEINDIIVEEAEDLINKQEEEREEEKVQENEKDTDEIDGTIVLESIDDHDSDNNNNSNANTSADEVVKSESPAPAVKDNV